MAEQVHEQKHHTKEELTSMVDKVFEKYDTNKNGFLELEEFKVLFKDRFGKVSKAKPSFEELFDSVLAKIDKNKDGKISK